VYGGKPLTLHLAMRDGKVLRAFGMGEFNKALHDVDASALAITEDSLKGPVKVTINADQWVPVGGKSIECQFDLDMAVKGGKLGGTYTGKRGSDEVSGMAMGTIQMPAAAIRAATINLELERGLNGEVNYSRVFLTISVADGKVKEVKAAGHDKRFPKWKAKVIDQKLTVTPESLTGEVTIEVSNVLAIAGDAGGTYTYTLDGKVIGPKIAGNLTSKLGDKAREPNVFTGSF
jgi:hypothetical protein